MRDFKKYEVWRLSRNFCSIIYSKTKNFPKEEIYGMTSQIRRASLSIPTNIAEGCGRDSDKDFNRFLIISHGSATEVEYLLFLSYELNYITIDRFNKLNDKVVVLRKQLNKLITIIKANS